ncbi:Rpn family recombination-promoting nuclease/putative transposase [Kosakonia sp. S42]|nr:Rpn family recombination-promoting nuclease/putative transposase [Kosakonia sp. S42]
MDEFNDPELAKRFYSDGFTLVDVTVIPDEGIMDHRSMAELTLLQKHIHWRDLTELLNNLATLLLTKHMTGQ